MSALEEYTKPELMAIIVRLEKRLGQLELRVEALEQEDAALRKRYAELEAENARLRKNSSNSSKPPSSDIVKPPKPKPKGKNKRKRRKIGGQPGHPKHERAPFSVEDLKGIWEYELSYCPDCGNRVKRAKAEPRVVQQVEVVKSPVRIEEHRGLAYYCRRCDKIHYAPLPPDVRKGGLVGPRLTALAAYHKYMKDFSVHVQFCLAHLIRDVKFLTTLSDRVTKNYGERVLDGLRRLFRVIHRRDEMTEAQFAKAIEKARVDLVATAKRAPPRSEAQNLAERFRKHGDAYFRFITTPGIEPTNNLAEQAIRFVVIDRRVTQGTRSETGRQWCERIWTVMATCAQQGRSVLKYIENAIRAYFNGQSTPSLLPAKP